LILVGDFLDYVALDDALADVLGAARVPGAPLVVFAHVDEAKIAHRLTPRDIVGGDLAHPRARFVDERFKLFRVLHLDSSVGFCLIFRRWRPCLSSSSKNFPRPISTATSTAACASRPFSIWRRSRRCGCRRKFPTSYSN